MIIASVHGTVILICIQYTTTNDPPIKQQPSPLL
jgi:hypothetical protein